MADNLEMRSDFFSLRSPDRIKVLKKSPNRISGLVFYKGLKLPGRETDLSRKSNVEVRYVALHLAVMLFMAASNTIFFKCC